MVCFDTIYNGTRTKTIDTINTKAKEDFKKERLTYECRAGSMELNINDYDENHVYKFKFATWYSSRLLNVKI